tara:strand:- start:45998 stop:46918 length:921 start_codon:yes stop_codon:yes gene_type:complete
MNLNHIKKLMDRKKNSRKGENGHVLVIGGSEQYVGAVTLASLAALRAGCDIVTVIAPEKVAWAINSYSPDLITEKLKNNSYTVRNAKELVKYVDKFDTLLLGNGIGKKAERFCQFFVRKSPKLKVIDADALKGMSFKDFQNCIVTPHYTELEIMLTNSHKHFLLPKLRNSNAKEKAEILQGNLRYFLHNNNVLLLKGPTDIIISRNKIAFNRTGNQGMTKAGTGDVLSGLAAGFLAKSGDLFKSAVAASFINGYLGDLLLKKRKGYSFIASDILDDLEKLSKVMKSGKSLVKKKAKRKKPAKKKKK